MAGEFPFAEECFKPIPWANVAIIASQWHREYLDVMVESTQQILSTKLQLEPQNVETHYLPGAYELPFAARTLYEQRPKLDAIIAFGIVLKGETTHDASVVNSVVQGFSSVMSEYKKPIINEVIGVTDIAHAKARQEFKGKEAAFALSQLLNWQRELTYNN